MKILHIQYSVSTSGNAAYRLHKAMLEYGMDSKMLAMTSNTNKDARISVLRKRFQLKNLFLYSKIHNYINKYADPKYGFYSYPFLGNDLRKNAFVKNADVIYLHWVQGGMLRLSDIEKLAKTGKPVFLFLHDMWFLTGGCHYSFDCKQFEHNCSGCPIFRDSGDFLQILPKKLQSNKHILYRKYENLKLIAPSHWISNLAKQASSTKKNTVTYVPNVVSEKSFRPLDKDLSRKIFGLPKGKKIILFGAASPKSPFKGWIYLREALNQLEKMVNPNEFLVVVFGTEYSADMADSIPFEINFLGRFNDELSMEIAYNAADVFVVPSIAETFGMVILESLRCGTPVVAFNIGGIPDLIDHKKNGYLAMPKNSEDLSNGILWCTENNARGYPKAEFSTKNTISIHRNAINEALRTL